MDFVLLYQQKQLQTRCRPEADSVHLRKYIKNTIFLSKYFTNSESYDILSIAVALIAMKREVAARRERVFRGANVKLGNWRQVTVQIKDRSASKAETVWDGHELG